MYMNVIVCYQNFLDRETVSYKEGTEPEFPGAEVEFITLEVLRYPS